MHGGVPQGKHGNDFQTGSSFSSAKAAAYGAYIISRHPDVSRDEVVELMKQGSRPFPMELAREKGDLPFIGEARGNESFLVAESSFKSVAVKEQDGADFANLVENGRGAVRERGVQVVEYRGGGITL